MTLEGRDRASIDFPLAQQTLVENIAKYNKNVNLVLLNGSPLEMCGVEKSVKSIIEVWYPGLEAGSNTFDIKQNCEISMAK